MEIHNARMACYGLCMEITLLFILMKYSRYTSHFIGLVHINDLVVINTWWSRPMHISMLHAKFVCYSCCIEITLIGSVWIPFLRISVEFNFSRNLRLILFTWHLNWNLYLQLGTRTGTHISVMVKHVLLELLHL